MLASPNRRSLSHTITSRGLTFICSISHIEASFNEISNKFRRFLIMHYNVGRGRMLVLAGVINRDIGVWKSDLSTVVGKKYSGTIPRDVYSPHGEMDDGFYQQGGGGGGVLLAIQPLSPTSASTTS